MTRSERELQRQNNRIAAGLCAQCGAERTTYKRFCNHCAVRHRVRNRRYSGYDAKVAGGPGRPCKVTQ